MSLRKTIYRLTAIGVTSTVLLAFSGVAAKAASFNLSYKFRNGIAFSALLDGDLKSDGNVVSINALESATLTDSTGALLDFNPEGLTFNSILTLDGGFAMLGAGSRDFNEPGAEGFKLFNNVNVGGHDFSFVELVYQRNRGNVVLAEGFRYNAYLLEKRDIPENSSAAVLLTALAGMGLAAAKKHRTHAEA